MFKEKKDEYGTLDAQELYQKLNQEGFTGAKIVHSPTATSIHLVKNKIRNTFTVKCNAFIS